MIVMLNPKSGEINNDKPAFEALSQLTGVSVTPGRREYAIATPKIDPNSVCELEHGIPKYQVNKFQVIALISNAITIDILWARS